MDIKEKMNLCLSDELLENTVLSENEKKVLAALLYSYKVCSKSHDGEIIRSMSQLREECQIKQNKMYDALRNLELLYHMIERTSGEIRVQGKSAKASVFKLNFEAIFNPPKTHMKFNFFEDMKSSETPMGTANTKANAKSTTKTNTIPMENINTGVYTSTYTGKSDEDIHEELSLNFSSSSKTRSELESEHYDTVVLPQLRRIELWDENPEPEGYKQISIMSGWNDFPAAAEWFENDIRSKVSEEDWNQYLCIDFNRVKDKYIQIMKGHAA